MLRIPPAQASARNLTKALCCILHPPVLPALLPASSPAPPRCPAPHPVSTNTCSVLFLLETHISNLCLHLACGAFPSLLFLRVGTHFSLRVLLGADACQVIVVLPIVFTIIICKYGSNHPRDRMLSTPKLGAKQKGFHPHALLFTCLPLTGEQFPSRWQAIKGFTLLHLVKTLNKEGPFPSRSEREQAVLASPREQISPWHDLPPAYSSGTQAANHISAAPCQPQGLCE